MIDGKRGIKIQGGCLQKRSTSFWAGGEKYNLRPEEKENFCPKKKKGENEATEKYV